MTFKDYLASRRITDTPQGDFTRDARSDKRLPDTATWSELRNYIQKSTSDDMVEAVTDAARAVWKAYRTKVRKSVGSNA